MSVRRTAVALTLSSCVLLAACKNDQFTGTAPITDATVRFVNATTTNVDLSTGGTVAAGNGNLAYGASSQCTVVDAANPGLAIQQAGTTTAITGFTPSFTAGGSYTVIAYSDASGATQFATLDNTAFVPSSSSGELRVFNAAPGAGSMDVYVGTGTTASAAAIAFGNGSAFFSVPAGTQNVMFDNTGTTTIAGTAANQTFTIGQYSTLVVAPPVAGATALSVFSGGEC